MNIEDILSILKNAAEPVSGEEISKKLGVSRAAVWKGIESLRTEGYEIDSAPRRGYTLVTGPDMLRAGEIQGRLHTKYLGKKLLCLETIDSTNTECKRRAAEEDAVGLVITSEEQTGGRGRLGRSFASPKGKGLYLSAVIRPDAAPSEVANITAWIGVAACNALERAFGIRPGIKWTNDLILGNKKLGGILTEMEVEAETGRIRHVIPGIGINCNHKIEDFPQEIHHIATSLAIETGKQWQRSDLAVCLIEEIEKVCDEFPSQKEKWLAQYKKDCITLGKKVHVLHMNGLEEDAEAVDIDDDFRLVIRKADGSLQAVSSADVSVRGFSGYAQ